MNPGTLRRLEVEVVSARADGSGERVAFSVPAGAAPLARPGQFVLVAPGAGAAARVLPEGWWLTGAQHDPLHGVRWEVSTRALGWQPGDRLALHGPLGRPFPVPKEPVTSLVIGYESGQATARWFAADLSQRGHPVALALVARDADHHLDLAATRRLAPRVLVVDGIEPPADAAAAPRQGGSPWRESVTQMITQEQADVVYAAGPAGICLDAARAATALGVVSQVTGYDPTAGQGCGIGLCHGCLRTLHGEGVQRWVRPCVSGPAVPGAALARGVDGRGTRQRPDANALRDQG